MAQYTYQQISQVGTVVILAAPTTSDTVVWDDRGFLYYQNSDAALRTITLVAPPGLDFGPSVLPDLSYNLAATTGRMWIPLPQDLADPVTGLITVNITATAGVTMAAVRR